MNVLLIDNYDSFTYNLYHYLMEIGATVTVYRNDAVSIEQIRELSPDAIVLSPGPCTPNEAGICLDLIEACQEEFPLFGVCLGHQSIAQAFGGNVVRGEKPMHAKISTMTHTGHALFKQIPTQFKATRYHSLVVEKSSLPECFDVVADSSDGVIQAIAHKTLPIFGVQFHPESIASQYGHQLLKNFCRVAKASKRKSS